MTEKERARIEEIWSEVVDSFGGFMPSKSDFRLAFRRRILAEFGSESLYIEFVREEARQRRARKS